MKTTMSAIFGIVAMAGLVGCGGNTFKSIGQTVDQEVSGGPASAPTCVLNSADYILNEQMVDFEITDTAGVDFGINLLSGFLNAFGLDISTESGQMTMYLQMANALNPSTSIATSQGQATMSSDNFSFNLGISLLSIGGSYFYQTPLSTLTNNTLANGLGNLRASFNSTYGGWTSHVEAEDADAGQYIIPDGSEGGIRLNDEFAFYNMNYVWQGAPCASNLISAVRTTVLPVATAVATQVSADSTVLQITSLNGGDSIALGAQVVASSLPLAAGETSRTLANSVQIGAITSATLPVTGGTSVNLTTFLTEQTQTLLTSYSWYPVGNLVPAPSTQTQNSTN